MVKVKCRYCKKQINKKEAYVVETINEKSLHVFNRYYCSEECYNNDLQGKKVKEEKMKEMEDLRKSTRNEFREILDITIERNLFFTNLYNDLESTYGVETIKNYLKHEKEYLINTLNRNYFETTNAKIKYFFKIVQGDIENYIKEDNIEENEQINNDFIDDFDLSTPTKEPKKKRSLNDIMKGV